MKMIAVGAAAAAAAAAIMSSSSSSSMMFMANALETNPAELMRFQQAGVGGAGAAGAAGVGGPFDGDRQPPMSPGQALPSGDDELAESFRFAEQAGRGGMMAQQGEGVQQMQQMQQADSSSSALGTESSYDDQEGSQRQQVIDFERSKEEARERNRRKAQDPKATPPKMMRFQEARVSEQSSRDAADGDEENSSEEPTEGGEEEVNPDDTMAANDAEASAPVDTSPLSEADIAKLRAAGKSDAEIATEQAKRKLTADKIAKASAALDAAEQNQVREESKAEAAEERLQNAAERTAEAGNSGALSTGEKEKMQAAIEKAGAQEQAKIAAARERSNVKGELIKEIKKEAEEQAEVEAADFADMSPEQILAMDKMDREQQFLTELTPNAIRAAEVELSSVFSSVIGSVLTNMLTREPELVARHMGVPTKKTRR